MFRSTLLCLVLLAVGCKPHADGPPPSPPAGPAPSGPAGGDLTPQQVFEKRILPIFQSPDPSSCTQCHLAGVDLKNYILPSHEKTFVSLRDQGLIDLDRPEASKILRLIKMGEENKGAALIQQKTRQAEYEAFAEWIKRSVQDRALREAPKLKPDEVAGPARPVEVIRHARKDRLLESFENTVWAMRFRCMSCHTEGTEANQKNVKEFGERVAWMKAAGPEATLAYLLKSRLLDADEPEKSLLLQKPLNAVKHGGGQKFLPGDQGYKAFRSFLEDYARIVADKYPDAASLPKEEGTEQFGCESWLKLADTPDAWGDKLLAVKVYAWDGRAKAWEAEPCATSDRGVWGKGKLWQHTLTLLAARGSERAKAWKEKSALPRGKYLVKVYVDADGRLAKDWKATLGPDDYVGQAEVESGWPTGYGQMTVIDAGKVKK
jgi:hypothetical protein